MAWKPSVPVAAVVERDGRFLPVEENTAHGPLYNQPTGHLERCIDDYLAGQRYPLDVLRHCTD